MNESTDNILKMIDKKKSMASAHSSNKNIFNAHADIISDEEEELENQYNQDRLDEVKPHPNPSLLYESPQKEDLI